MADLPFDDLGGMDLDNILGNLDQILDPAQLFQLSESVDLVASTSAANDPNIDDNFTEVLQDLQEILQEANEPQENIDLLTGIADDDNLSVIATEGDVIQDPAAVDLVVDDTSIAVLNNKAGPSTSGHCNDILSPFNMYEEQFTASQGISEILEHLPPIRIPIPEPSSESPSRDDYNIECVKEPSSEDDENVPPISPAFTPKLMSTSVPSTSVGTQTDGSPSSAYKCDECDYSTCWKSNLQSHKGIHLKKQLFCSKCTYTTRDPRILKYHETNIHAPQEGRLFKCHLCEMTTPSYTTYTQHVKYHHPEVHGGMGIKTKQESKTTEMEIPPKKQALLPSKEPERLPERPSARPGQQPTIPLLPSVRSSRSSESGDREVVGSRGINPYLPSNDTYRPPKRMDRMPSPRSSRLYYEPPRRSRQSSQRSFEPPSTSSDQSSTRSSERTPTASHETAVGRHGDVPSSRQDPPPGRSFSERCGYCRYRTTNGYRLQLHMKACHEQNTARYKCDKCGFRTNNVDIWRPHVRSHRSTTYHTPSTSNYHDSKKYR